MQENKYFGIFGLVILMQTGACDQETSENQRLTAAQSEVATAEKIENDGDKTDCVSTGLNLETPVINYEDHIQGITNNCAGCHNGNHSSYVNLSSYQEAATTLASKGGLGKIKEMIAADHQGSYNTASISLLDSWEAAGFPPTSDLDSPFFDESDDLGYSKGLEDYDPFAAPADTKNEPASAKTSAKCE